MNKKAFITGATSGIGEATAKILAKNGFDLILTGRRLERLENLSAFLTKEYSVSVRNLNFDIQNNKEVENAYHSLPEEWQNIDVLINNAGLAAGFDEFQNASLTDWEQMIDTNVKGLLYITKLVCPVMIKKNSGHIINISSIAGKEVYPKGNVYCATKSAVLFLTKALRLDLLPHGIKVSSVCPGAVKTEFSLVRFKGDEERAEKVYDGIKPLTAEDIAEIISFIIQRPPHVNIDDILITPVAQGYSRDFNRK